MSTPIQYVQSNTFSLAGSGVIQGATTATLNSFTDIYGNVLTMASFGTKGYGTAEPDTSNEEGFTFTSVTANANGTYTLGGVSTILAQSPYTETSGLIRNHAGGASVVITDNVAFWNTFANKANDEVITGTWTFNNFPVTPSNPVSSNTTLGITKLSVAAATPTNPIAVGTNDVRVPSADPTTLFAPISVTGKSADVQVFTSSGTWTKPTGAKAIEVIVISGGGGGAGGSGNGSNTPTGGGAGVVNIRFFNATNIGATEAITVGAGGSGGAGSTIGSTSAASGGNSSFGTHSIATGGAGGSSVQAGGGSVSPFTSASGNQVGNIGSSNGNAEWGGASSGTTTGAGTGFSSIYSGGGGASGNNATGGTSGSYSQGGGGAGSGTANVPASNGANATNTIGYGGSGGGSGSNISSGSNALSTGGNGGFPAGGGGAGGTAGNGTGANGGTGGAGQVTVITYF